MSYFRRVVKKRSPCMTDQEIATLLAKAREHALAIQKINGVWKEPVVPTVIFCAWCRAHHSPAEVEKCMAIPRPVAPSGANGTSSSNAKMGRLLAEYSKVWEFLSDLVYSDGKPRLAGTLSLRLVCAGLQVTLADPSSATYCCLTTESLDDALLAFEVGLSDGTLPWRPSSYSKAKK